MDKISITIDVTKINKNKIHEKKYIKNGEEVVSKNYKLDVVPLKTVSVVASGENWVMKKTHFVAETLTKEEREKGVETNYIGSGFKFEKKEPVVQQTPEPVENNYPQDQIELEDIPF